MPNDPEPTGDPEADRDLAGLLGVLAGGPPEVARERIALALRRALTLRIFTDDRVPSERWLAEAFGVSRITVRQALGLLRDQGMVRSGGSRRAGMVSLPRSTSDPSAPTALLAGAMRDIADIMVFRAVVESEIARLAATRADAALTGRLRASVAALEEAADPTAFRRADSEFHLALARACGNRRLMGAVLVARADLLRWRDLLPMPDDVAENLAEHGRIVTAIEAGDGDAAAAAMAEHLSGTLASFEAHVRGMASVAGGATPPAATADSRP